MGNWGPGLYSNDLSLDLKAVFAELVRLPFAADELLQKLLQAFPAGCDTADEDYTHFWLTTADLFHGYGLSHDEVFDTAERIISSGTDLKLNRELDMSEADLRKRARALDKLAPKWRTPHPKPKARRSLSSPEPLLFEPGDCVIYPTQKGNAVGAHLSAAEIKKSFAPDGWGAFVVFATARRHGFFACYLVARLFLNTADRPTLDDCAKAAIAGLKLPLPFVSADPAVKVVKVDGRTAKKLAGERIGRYEWDRPALETAFAEAFRSLDQPSWSLPGLLRPYSEGTVVLTERPVRLKKLPLRRFLSIP